MKKIIIALPKGRIELPSYEFFARKDNGFRNKDFESGKLGRLLSFESDLATYLLPKPGDIPKFVSKGFADVGIAGYDSITEYEIGRELKLLEGCGFASIDVDSLGKTGITFPKTKFCIIGRQGEKERYQDTNKNFFTVGTKYRNIAREYFNKRHIGVSIIEMSGSCEIAPKFLNANIIFDIVETGSTLRANGLEIYEDAMDNPVNLLVKYSSTEKLPQKLKRQIESCGNTL